MFIQRGQFKRFHIKRSAHGLGAFASQGISKGEPIGEYIGQLVEGADHMDMIQRHSHLNYCYGLTETSFVLDAQWLGNPTRFLNDSWHVPPGSRSEPKEPNCNTRENVVNGERRLVVYAEKKIKKGAELFLSYGDVYWLDT
ncbi:hypothetical protein B0H17DRAFT_1043509 [Mycena rosella]|uniref:SET domain-containing protein n=1 Tax=Mycena rosella TaxID=1033263 RepID=A0AAD7E0G3_MYCRO|nr:hypothetical protein B0H17DRAFT_1043509 [Mycena rosella]